MIIQNIKQKYLYKLTCTFLLEIIIAGVRKKGMKIWEGLLYKMTFIITNGIIATCRLNEIFLICTT